MLLLALGICAVSVIHAGHSWYRLVKTRRELDLRHMQTHWACKDMEICLDRLHLAEASLKHVQTALNHWRGLALSFEVLCECVAEADYIGAENAHKSAAREREALTLLGQYDA